MGIKSDILGRRFVWATKHVVPPDAWPDDDDDEDEFEDGDAMGKAFANMRKMQGTGKVLEPEPEPEQFDPDETLGDVRAQNAGFAIEIKRLRAELEVLEGGFDAVVSPAVGDRGASLQTGASLAEWELLDDQQNKINTIDASLDVRIREISARKAAVDYELRQSKDRVREKDAELRKVRAVLRTSEAAATAEVMRTREMEVEVRVVRSRRQTAAKMVKHLEVRVVISKDTAETAAEDIVKVRKQDQVNQKALSDAQAGMAAKTEGAAEAEEARLSKELGEEKQLRASVKKDAKEMRKQLARKEQQLEEKILELDTKLRRANRAQQASDGLYSEAQQLFDHSNLVLSAQSRRMDEMARRRHFAEGKLAAISPRSKGPSRSPAVSPAAAAAANGALEVALQKAPAAPPNSPDLLPPVQQQDLPATPQSPLRAGLHVIVRSPDASDKEKEKEPARQGRIVAVSPSRSSCSVVFDNGEVNESVPLELLERQRQEWEFRPKLQVSLY